MNKMIIFLSLLVISIAQINYKPYAQDIDPNTSVPNPSPSPQDLRCSKRKTCEGSCLTGNAGDKVRELGHCSRINPDDPTSTCFCEPDVRPEPDPSPELFDCKKLRTCVDAPCDAGKGNVGECRLENNKCTCK